jgi:hypothetical protein
MNPALNDGLVGQPPHRCLTYDCLSVRPSSGQESLRRPLFQVARRARDSHALAWRRKRAEHDGPPRFGGLLRARQLPSPSPPGPRAIAVVVRWEVPERRVQPARVVPGLDPLEERAPRLAPPGQQRWRMSYFLSEPKNDSQTALSSAEPFAPIEMSMPAWRQRWPKTCDARTASPDRSGGRDRRRADGARPPSQAPRPRTLRACARPSPSRLRGG